MNGKLMRRVLAAAALAALPATGSAQQPCDDTYTVRSGETLAQVAERCRVALWALIRLNPDLDSGDRLRPGQELRIPGARTVAPTDRAGSEEPRPRTVHEVQAGETLGEIAARYRVPVAAILRVNDLRDPNVLSIGERVVIPGSDEITDAEQLAAGAAGAGTVVPASPAAPSEPTSPAPPAARQAVDAPAGGMEPVPEPVTEAGSRVSVTSDEPGAHAGPRAALEVRASGFPPHGRVHVGVGPPGSSYVVVRDTAADADGRVDARVPLPDWIEADAEYVVVVETTDHSVEAVSAPFRAGLRGGPGAEAKRVTAVTGTLVEGTGSCRALRTDDGRIYTLAQDIPFLNGTRVTVVGSPEAAEASACSEGPTLDVEDVEPAGDPSARPAERPLPPARGGRGPAPEEPRDGVYRVEGTFFDGEECPGLRTAAGAVYSLTGVDLVGLEEGAPIAVEGTRARVSFCGEGVTLMVRELSRPGG